MNRLPAFLIIFLAGAGVGALITATALSTPEEDQERPRVVVDDATSPGATAIPEASTPAPTPAEAAEGAGAPGLAAVLESVPVEEVGALAGSISGTVALQSGEPIAGVRIVGTPLRKAGGKKKSEEPEDLESHVRRAVHDFRWREALRATAVTGEDGHYVLEGLGDAGYRLKATRDGYRLKRRQRRTASGVKPGAVVDFIASPSVTIPIDVRMPDGSLAREAELRIRHGDRVTRHERWSPSDNELTLDPGRVQLSATLDDRYHTEPVWVTADLSEAPAPVTLQLQSRGGVKGQVRFPAEEIGGSARVYLTEVPPGSTPDPQVLLGASKNDWLNSVRPEFSFLDLEPGTYLVGAGRGYQQVDVTDFVVVGGDVVEVELAIPPIDRSQAVVVRAYGPDGEELPDARASMGYRTENRSSTGGAQTVRRRDGSLWVLPGDECWDILEGRVDGTCFVQVESDEHGTGRWTSTPRRASP
ncbi:MAG: carboxypeptidase-like regulatory domain-containing protein [Planctomycetota bacterium]